METNENDMTDYFMKREEENDEVQNDDIYGDIEDFDLGTEIDKVNEKNRLLEENIQMLKRDKENLTEAMDALSTQQNILKTNISSLYLTAKTELDRKNRIIVDLRTELEDLKFRRVGKRNLHQSYEDYKPAKIPKIEPEKMHDEYYNSNVRNLLKNNPNCSSNTSESNPNLQDQIIIRDESNNDQQEIQDTHSEYNNYENTRKGLTESGLYSKPPIIDLVENRSRGVHDLENRPGSRNSEGIISGESRPLPDQEENHVNPSRTLDRSRSRDGRFASEYPRSKSTGREHFNRDKRYDRNNGFNTNYDRGHDYFNKNFDNDRNRRGDDFYYNNYDNRFRDRNIGYKKDFRSGRHWNDQESFSRTRDPRQPDYKNDRNYGRGNRTSSYDRRSRASSRDRRHNENNEAVSDKRRPDKYRERTKSESDMSKIIDKIDEEITVLESNVDGEETEPKRTDYTKISYSEYRQRKELEMKSEDIVALEAARKALLEELKGDLPSKTNFEPDPNQDEELEDGEISVLSRSESHSISITEDDVRSTNTTQLTMTSEESEGKLPQKRNKKKLKFVAKLERKILKTPIKKDPEPKNKQTKEVKNKRNDNEMKTKHKDITNRKLFTLFDEVDNEKQNKNSKNKSCEADVIEKSTKLEKKKNTKETKENLKQNSSNKKIESSISDKMNCDNDGHFSESLKDKGAPQDNSAKADQRQNSKKLLEAMLPSNEVSTINAEEDVNKNNDIENYGALSNGLTNKETSENETVSVKKGQKEERKEFKDTANMSAMKNNSVLSSFNVEDTISDGNRQNMAKNQTVNNSGISELTNLQHKTSKSPILPETIENIFSEVKNVFGKDGMVDIEDVKVLNSEDSWKHQLSNITIENNFKNEKENEVKAEPAVINNQKNLNNKEAGKKVSIKITESKQCKSAIKSDQVEKTVEENEDNSRTNNKSEIRKSSKSDSSTIKKETKSNTKELKTELLPAKRRARSSSFHVKYLFESSDEDSDTEQAIVKTTIRKRAKSVCEVVHEECDPNSEKNNGDHKYRISDKTSGSNSNPGSLQNYRIPKKKSSQTTQIDKNVNNGEQKDDKNSKEKAHHNQNEVKPQKDIKKRIKDKKDCNTDAKEMKEVRNNKADNEINEIAGSIKNDKKTDKKYSNKTKEIPRNDKHIIPRNETEENKDAIGNPLIKYDNNKNRKDVEDITENTRRTKIIKARIEPDENNDKIVDIVRNDDKEKNYNKDVDKTTEPVEKYKNNKAQKNADTAKNSVEDSTIENKRKNNKNYKTKHEIGQNNDNTVDNIAKHIAKKENKTYEKKKSTHTDDDNRTSQTKSRKRKVSETMKENSEKEEKNSNDTYTKDTKKIKMESEPDKKGTHMIHEKEKKVPESVKKIEKRQYSVPTNIGQLSTTDAIRDILKETFADQQSSPEPFSNIENGTLIVKPIESVTHSEPENLVNNQMSKNKIQSLPQGPCIQISENEKQSVPQEPPIQMSKNKMQSVPQEPPTQISENKIQSIQQRSPTQMSENKIQSVPHEAPMQIYENKIKSMEREPPIKTLGVLTSNNDEPNLKKLSKKIILLSDVRLTPPKVKKFRTQNVPGSCERKAECHSVDKRTCQKKTDEEKPEISTMSVETVEGRTNELITNSKRDDLIEVQVEEKPSTNQIVTVTSGETNDIVADDLNISGDQSDCDIVDATKDAESSNSTVIEKEIPPIEPNSGKRKPRTKGRKPAPEVKELRRSKRNMKNDTSTEDKSLDNSKDKNTEKPPAPAPVSSFKNILEHNDSTSFQKILKLQNSLHLTHEGEIPVLNLDENHFSNLTNDIISKNPDKNIIKLLDSMNISNMECDIQDSEEPLDTEENVTSAIRESANESLTFENFLGKASSTPLTNKIVPNATESSNINNCRNNDEGPQEVSESTKKTILFPHQTTELPPKKRLPSNNTPDVGTKSSLEIREKAPCGFPIVVPSSVSTSDANCSDSNPKTLVTAPEVQTISKLSIVNINEHLNNESSTENVNENISVPLVNSGNVSEASKTWNMNISNNSINDKNQEKPMDGTVGNLSFPRRRRCRMVRIG